MSNPYRINQNCFVSQHLSQIHFILLLFSLRYPIYVVGKSLAGEMRRPSSMNADTMSRKVDVDAMARKLEVDNGIPLRNHHRMANNLLQQALHAKERALSKKDCASSVHFPKWSFICC